MRPSIRQRRYENGTKITYSYEIVMDDDGHWSILRRTLFFRVRAKFHCWYKSAQTYVERFGLMSGLIR